MTLFITRVFTALTLLVSLGSHATEHVVRMLNLDGDQTMLFQPAFVNAKVGDTVRFEPTQSGHYVRALAVPAQATAWQSEIDKPFTVKLEHQGLYFYMCPPHLMMGMVGLVQVGNAVNLDAVRKSMQSSKGRMYSNSARIDALLAQVK